MRNKPIFVYFILTLLLYILSSVFLKNITMPDIAFIVLVFFCIYIGPIYGSILGFFCGLSLDILSISPLGFHSAILLSIGYVYGKIKGKIFVDPIIVPIVIIAVSIFLKTMFGYVVLLLLDNQQTVNFFYASFWRKFFFTCLASPFVYFVLRSFRLIDLNQKD